MLSNNVLKQAAVQFFTPFTVVLIAFSGLMITIVQNDKVMAESTILAGSDWLNGSGVNVMSGGDDSKMCVAVASAPAASGCPAGTVWSGSKWQCVEMVNRLFLTKGWISSTWYGNGNTIGDSVPAGLVKQNNGEISYVNPGDAVSMDDGGYGHANIINSINAAGTINLINQNAQLNSSAYINSGTLAGSNAFFKPNAWAGYSILSVIHAPSSGSATSASVRTILTSDNHVQTFKISNGVLRENWYSPSDGSRGAWTQPVGPPSPAQGAAAVVKRAGQNVIDVFIRGGNNQVYTTWYNFQTGQWGGWIGMGGGPLSFTSNPQVVLASNGNYQVFGTGGNVVEQNWYNPNSGTYGGWTTSPGFGAGAVGTPALAPRAGQNVIDAFVRGGTNNYVYETWYNFQTGNWGGWINIWGSLQNDPQVMPTSDGHVQIFGTGLNVLRQIWFSPSFGTYGGWTTSPGFGSNAIGVPAIMLRNGQNVIDAFVHASNNQVYETWYNFQTGSWGGWIGMGGGPLSFMSDPQALATPDGNYQVFGTGGGVVEQNWFNLSTGSYGGWTTI